MYDRGDDSEEEEENVYTAKFGHLKIITNNFDDHSLLGANFLQYKPSKINFWTGKKKDGKMALTGVQTFFKNIIDNELINAGENKGSKSEFLTEFKLNPNEYLTQCIIWEGGETINKVKLTTNKGSVYEVGEESGNEIVVNQPWDGDMILISFFGSYGEYLETLGLHRIKRKSYLRVLFTGYFELKEKLKKKENFKEAVLKGIKEKKYNEQDTCLIKTCLLPNTPFAEVMRFCVV